MNANSFERFKTVAAAGAILAGVSALTYRLIARPWHLRWGATDDEVRRPMPGDDLVAAPLISATRAVTIHAPPRVIWPWLVQMGYRRAGWYSYDWVDNDGIEVKRILPEFQGLKVGDTLLTGPDAGFRVEELAKGRHVILLIRKPEACISSVLALEPLDAARTRLVIRLRAEFHGLRGRLFGLVFDPGDFFMMRKMLLGIKRRVESAAVIPEIENDNRREGEPETVRVPRLAAGA